MGKVINKEDGKLLAEFDTEEEGKTLKAEYKAKGINIKMEW